MPTFEITSPDGKVYEVNAPKGSTAEQAFQFFKQTKPELFVSGGPSAAAPTAGEGMPVSRRKAVQGLTVAQERGDLPQYDIGEAAAATGRGALKAFGGIGDIGGSAIGLPTSEEVAQTFNLQETPPEYAPFELVGGLVGPQVIGKVGGTLAKGITGATNMARNYLNPKLMSYLNAAEGKGGEILNWLRGAEELVPGSQPTVAQAIAAAPIEQQSARFASLQPRGANIPEDARTAYFQRQAQQAAAREASAGTVAGTPMSAQMAEGQRLARAEPLYEAARSPVNPADLAPVTAKIDELIAANPRTRALVDKLNSVKENLVGITNGREAVSALDDLKTIMKTEKDSFIIGELKKVKDEFVKTVPGLEAAETTFREASKPINTMNIGTYLKDALTGPLEGGAERASAFATALKNAPATIKKSTGQSRFATLEEAGVPKADIEKLNNIKADLERAAAAEKLQRAGSPTSVNIKAPELNFFDKFITLANNVSRIMAGKISDKVATEIALEMLDPQVAAKVLERAMAFDKANAARMRAATSVAPSVGYLGATGGLVNALAPPSQNNLAAQAGQ